MAAQTQTVVVYYGAYLRVSKPMVVLYLAHHDSQMRIVRAFKLTNTGCKNTLVGWEPQHTLYINVWQSTETDVKTDVAGVPLTV